MSVLVAAFYRFAALEGLPDLQRELGDLAAAEGVSGTILLAAEGVNGTIAGADAGVQALLARLRQVAGLERLEAKFSRSEIQAFHRLKVRLKREIVTMGEPQVSPYLASAVGTHVPPGQWDALIADPDTLVIDTRNAYEVAIGSFAGAIDPGTTTFREFPHWVEQELRPLVEQRQPVGIEAGEGEVVHRADHREAVLAPQPIDELERLLLVPDVERAGGLVEQQDRRLLRECPCDHEPLALATAHRAEVSAGEVHQIEPLEHAGHHRPVVRRLDPEVRDVRVAAEQHVLGTGHVGGQLR
jgi:hypothetical protein